MDKRSALARFGPFDLQTIHEIDSELEAVIVSLKDTLQKIASVDTNRLIDEDSDKYPFTQFYNKIKEQIIKSQTQLRRSSLNQSQAHETLNQAYHEPLCAIIKNLKDTLESLIRAIQTPSPFSHSEPTHLSADCEKWTWGQCTQQVLKSVEDTPEIPRAPSVQESLDIIKHYVSDIAHMRLVNTIQSSWYLTDHDAEAADEEVERLIKQYTTFVEEHFSKNERRIARENIKKALISWNSASFSHEDSVIDDGGTDTPAATPTPKPGSSPTRSAFFT